MKKIVISGALLFILVFVVLFVGVIWYSSQLSAPTNIRETKRVVINRGSGVTQIAQKLEEEGIIQNSLAFRIYTQLNNLTGKIPAGEFDLAQNLPVGEVIKTMIAGPSQIWVTLPEGMRREQIAEIVSEELNIDKNEFLQLTREREGYLYPDTYLFPKEVKAQAVVNRLVNTFESKTKDFSVDEDDINLAAILERETKNVKTEGPIVAGILLKRIAAGWPIQADATVQYALGKAGQWWPTPTRADLQIDHPYNTYKIQGLPPSPIASPGIEAIKAALSPQESDYWFYIHGTDGKIYFAVTLDEHNENVRKYIK